MKELRLRVTFQWFNVIADTITKEKVEYLRNYQEIIDYVSIHSSANLSCEIFDIVPDEISA